jgi:hypothetical protein
MRDVRQEVFFICHLSFGIKTAKPLKKPVNCFISRENVASTIDKTKLLYRINQIDDSARLCLVKRRQEESYGYHLRFISYSGSRYHFSAIVDGKLRASCNQIKSCLKEQSLGSGRWLDFVLQNFPTLPGIKF